MDAQLQHLLKLINGEIDNDEPADNLEKRPASDSDLELLDASGSLVDVIFWEHDQDIYALAGRKYIADSAGFADGTMMARLADEIDDMSFGLYPDVYGISAPPGQVNLCGTDISDRGDTDQYGDPFTITGTLNLDGMVDLTWINTWGDRGTVVLTPQ